MHSSFRLLASTLTFSAAIAAVSLMLYATREATSQDLTMFQTVDWEMSHTAVRAR